MPTVLITGINGFVAVHTAVVFLSHGWNIRGTVRSKEKGEKTKALSVFADAVKDGKFDYVIVEDFVEGDWSQAVNGVDAIAHCATPWHFKGKTWPSYRDPAIQGTTRVLEAAAKSGVKSISVVSSFASIGDFSKPATEQPGRVYTEEDWNPLTEEEAEKLSGDMAPVMWYCASKKYAELAAIETQKKLGSPFTLGTVCPPVILGPPIHYDKATKDDLLNSDVSTTDTYKALAAGKDAEIGPSPFPVYADVRQVAEANYEIISRKANGRFALRNDLYEYQGLANRARELFPDLAEKIPVGNPDNLPANKGSFDLDGSKSAKELGIKYISKDQMIKDTVEQFKKIGAY